jgi:hypothetical protein
MFTTEQIVLLVIIIIAIAIQIYWAAKGHAPTIEGLDQTPLSKDEINQYCNSNPNDQTGIHGDDGNLYTCTNGVPQAVTFSSGIDVDQPVQVS